ncbi:hypothetical protein [Mucilaginibacter sp. CSA2-8R]|uniref:hypothetical protein n=1 Tax=Mucilaginibacter sp. CSA2-8R TaxID=3141542 RepID=UPI00315DF1A8
MKILYTLILSACSVAVMAQTKTNRSRTSQKISDNGKTLQITVNGDVNGRTVNYDKTFDVANLNQAEKEALKQRIADSLGIAISNSSFNAASVKTPVNVPPLPAIPGTPAVAATGESRTTQNLSTSVHDDNGTMQVQIKGYQGQKQINYNRQFNVKGMSKARKDAIVKHITDSLGVSTPPATPKN